MSKVLRVAIAGGGIVIAASAYRSTPFDALFEQAGSDYQLSPDLLRGIARRESSLRPSVISAPNSNGTRDYGLMQINERTAASYGIPLSSLLDPQTNIEAGARLLDEIRITLTGAGRFNPWAWVSSYNEGAGREIRSGIINSSYTAAVLVHWFLYAVARRIYR